MSNAIRYLVFLFLIIILIGFICAGCGYPCIEGYKFKHDEQFEDMKSVFAWMNENYNYVPDRKESWQLPEETYNRLQGDCEDWTLLAMYFLNEIGVESELYGVELKIYYGGHHTLINIDHVYYESWGGNLKRSDFELDEIYLYCEAIGKAEED